MKIKGFDAIKKKTDELSRFSKEIDGELASVQFDPRDPASIEAALQLINDAIDAKTKPYARNDWIQSLAEQMKEHGRNSVLEKAAAARIGK